MDYKLSILQEILPMAMLRALTPQALDAVPTNQLNGDFIAIRKFPFRIGRESRVVSVNGRIVRVERTKEGNSEPSNDLYLVDRGHRLNISRKHLQIEKRDGEYYLVDRGSACGIIIEGGGSLGGDDEGGITVLRDGDIIGLGATNTPYVFQFISFTGYEVVRNDSN